LVEGRVRVAEHRRAAGVSHYFSVIATPHSEMGWMAPELDDYLTREDEHGVLICERGTVWEP
jgi:hypothetical protein